MPSIPYLKYKKMISIEWFFEKAKIFVKEDSDDFEDLFNYYYQSKKMHKQEMSDSYQDGWMSCEKSLKKDNMHNR